MNIRCLRCGHTIMLGAAYDTFAGPVRCVVCKQLLKVRIEGGHLRAIELEQKPAAPARATSAKADPT